MSSSQTDGDVGKKAEILPPKPKRPTVVRDQSRVEETEKKEKTETIEAPSIADMKDQSVKDEAMDDEV